MAGHVRFRNCASSFWSGSSNSVASEANAKKYDSSEARAVFSNRAKELFGASGTDLLFKEEKQEKKGFNQRFKSVYEEPFKAGPKSKAFPRSGNRYTTFKE